MNLIAIFIVATLLLLAIALVIWAWFAMARVEEALRSVSGFERKDFEIGPKATAETGTQRALENTS